MAKQQRMFILTAACILAAIEVSMGWPPRALAAALTIISIGSLATAWLRALRIVRELEMRP